MMPRALAITVALAATGFASSGCALIDGLGGVDNAAEDEVCDAVLRKVNDCGGTITRGQCAPIFQCLDGNDACSDPWNELKACLFGVDQRCDAAPIDASVPFCGVEFGDVAACFADNPAPDGCVLPFSGLIGVCADGEDCGGLGESCQERNCGAGLECVDNGAGPVCSGPSSACDPPCPDDQICDPGANQCVPAMVPPPECGQQADCDVGQGCLSPVEICERGNGYFATNQPAEACEAFADGNQRSCRQRCNDNNECANGERCWLLTGGFDDAPAGGYCLPGACDSTANCVPGLECLDVTNGPGSGFCGQSCDPMQCFDPASPCDPCDGMGNCLPQTPEARPEAYRCVSAGGAAVGSPCRDNPFDCPQGTACVRSAGATEPQCQNLCQDDSVCPTVGCAPFDESGTEPYGVCGGIDIVDPPPVGDCIPTSCDADSCTGCGTGEICVPNPDDGAWRCEAEVAPSFVVGDSCGMLYECERGAVCSDSVCRTVCRHDDPTTCSDGCGDFNAGFGVDPTYGVCSGGGEDSCQSNDDCANGVCDSLPMQCTAVGIQPYNDDCSFTPDTRRCLEPCDPSDPDTWVCGDGERCYRTDANAEGGICAPGQCESVTADCDDATEQCVDYPGRNMAGLCASMCQPEDCIGGACACPTSQYDACIPRAQHDDPNNHVFVCAYSSSTLTEYETCDPFAFDCPAGSTCTPDAQGVNKCQPYCDSIDSVCAGNGNAVCTNLTDVLQTNYSSANPLGICREDSGATVPVGAACADAAADCGSGACSQLTAAGCSGDIIDYTQYVCSAVPADSGVCRLRCAAGGISPCPAGQSCYLPTQTAESVYGGPFCHDVQCIGPAQCGGIAAGTDCTQLGQCAQPCDLPTCFGPSATCCGGATVCQPHTRDPSVSAGHCGLEGAKGEGEACLMPSDCVAGLGCVALDSMQPRCERMCDIDADCGPMAPTCFTEVGSIIGFCKP
jgi:hypothetical protein